VDIMQALDRGNTDDERLLLLGRGEDYGLGWELWLHQAELRPGWYPLVFRWPGGGSGTGTPLHPGTGLAGLRGVDQMDPRPWIVGLHGEIGKQFDSVHVEFEDGSRQDAVLLKPPDLPVNFFVVLVSKRPKKLVARTALGQDDLLDDPVPDFAGFSDK
jgi:hypothetical protein